MRTLKYFGFSGFNANSFVSFCVIVEKEAYEEAEAQEEEDEG
jgi:hypothetical protein